MGVSTHVITLIRNYIQTVSSVMVEGSPARPFKNQRGLRQGDLISPILFNLVMDILSRIIFKAVEEGKFHSYMVNGAKSLLHLIDADDILIFSKVNPKSPSSISY